MSKLSKEFYLQDVLKVAPLLLGKKIVLQQNNQYTKHIITEVEAYRGTEDLACHASKGRTKRTEIMFHSGGNLYIYLIYGMYYMLNVVTGKKENPQAVLIRGIEGYNGPGKLTKALDINLSFYGENLLRSNRIWIEDAEEIKNYNTSTRIGIDYAGEVWKNKKWRFYV